MIKCSKCNKTYPSVAHYMIDCTRDASGEVVHNCAGTRVEEGINNGGLKRIDG